MWRISDNVPLNRIVGVKICRYFFTLMASKWNQEMVSEKDNASVLGTERELKPSFRLFYHATSSASLRVILYLRCREIPETFVQLVSTGFSTDDRGIPVFTMPEGDPETEKLGTSDLLAFNPEGRIPILLLPDGRKMTQSGPIIEYLDDCIPRNVGHPILPEDSWARAEVRRITWIVAADIQPYQNIPFIIQAIGEWGMIKTTPLTHPLRLHFIKREFGAMEHIMQKCSGDFSVGDTVTLADCFLVPQIRNALLAQINLPKEFPTISRVWDNLLKVQTIADTLEEFGGVVQPFAFNSSKFELYVKGSTP